MGIKNKKCSNELEKEIIAKYLDGFSSVKLGIEFSLNPTTITNILKRNNIEIRSNKQNSRKYIVDNNYFKIIDTEHKAYWLGFLHADGYVTSDNKVGISLASDDGYILNQLLIDLKSNYPVNRYISNSGYSNKTEYHRVVISSNKMKEDLGSHGVVENKTNILTFPNTIPEELMKHFIRGYFDGDGCISKSVRKNSEYFNYAIKILGTDDFLDGIKTFIHKNKIAKINKYSKRKSDQIVSCLEFGGKFQVKNFLDLMYKDATIYLERKFNRYTSLCDEYSRAYQER